ncbi:MAG TPA: phospholipase D-like domain-containing protein [Steroidobacteraceae bacterium]
MQTLLLVGIFVSAAAAALHALLTKSDPRSAMSWIAVCCLFPLGGPALYWLFGINRVATRAGALPRRGDRDGAAGSSGAGDAVGAGDAHGPERAALAALCRVGSALTGLPLVEGNALEPLHNGEVAFPRMLRAISEARHSVWLATYIFQTDAVGLEFVEALRAAAARGVAVRVLVDGIGEWYDWPHVVPLLRRAKVTAARFLPPRLWPPNLSLNCRNHRKLLVIDGVQAFMGGMNLGGRETGGSTGRRMTDIHFDLRGPIVAQLAQTFAADWQFATGESLPPVLPPPAVGQCSCRVLTGGPDEGIDKLLLVIVAAIAAAQRQILIMTPYFIPPPELVAALQAAALRGVDVALVLPKHSNLRYIDWATLHWLPALVAREVKVYLQPPPFSHAKLFVVDGAYAHIGSVNLDTRSLRLNFEIAVELFDGGMCADLAQGITAVRARAPALTTAQLGRVRPLVRLRDSLCWLISPYL